MLADRLHMRLERGPRLDLPEPVVSLQLVQEFPDADSLSDGPEEFSEPLAVGSDLVEFLSVKSPGFLEVGGPGRFAMFLTVREIAGDPVPRPSSRIRLP